MAILIKESSLDYLMKKITGKDLLDFEKVMIPSLKEQLGKPASTEDLLKLNLSAKKSSISNIEIQVPFTIGESVFERVCFSYYIKKHPVLNFTHGFDTSKYKDIIDNASIIFPEQDFDLPSKEALQKRLNELLPAILQYWLKKYPEE
jgi:hypothetical protein